MNYREEIKAILFDYDGTLIDFNYQASPYTIKALELLKERDYKIGLSSGRPCFLALKAFKDVFGDYPLDYIFGCNGAEFYDCRSQETRLLTALPADDVVKIGRLIDCDFLMAGIYDGETFLVNRLIDDQEFKDWLNARWLKPVVFDYEQNTSPRSKVILINKREDREKENQFLSDKDLSGYSCFYSSPNCFEIAPKGVSKARSIEVLCELLNCDRKQILSFGDMENDLPMLKISTGVIMENAAADLKAEIPLKTARVDEEGIYDFLSKNGLL